MIPRPSRRTAALVVAAVVGLHGTALVAYLARSEAIVYAGRYLLYPVVWIAVAAWIALRVRPGASGSVVPAAAVGLGYLLALLALGGAIGAGSGSDGGLSVVPLAPGWGPAVLYGGVVEVSLLPFEVAGYLALSYLVAVAVAEAGPLTGGGAAIPGRLSADGSGSQVGAATLGLASCVGCTWPLLAGVAGAVGGGGLAAAVGPWSYDLSTALFLASAGVLLLARSRA